MTQPPGKPATLQAHRARNTLIRTIRDQLKGQGLDIRELDNELVISHSGNPDKGRIYINYTNGDVSLRRTIWDYLGRLDGHPGTSQDLDPDAEPPVTIDNIITTLARPPVTSPP